MYTLDRQHQAPTTAAIAVRRRNELGAGTLEYIGIAVGAAIIISALLLAPMAPQMTAGISNIICGVTSHIPGVGGSCDGQDSPSHEAFQQPCVISRGSSSANVNGSVLFIDGEQGASMVIEELSDGNFAVTIMDDKGIGASATPVELELGPVFDGGVGVGAMIRHSNGETYVFDNEDDAVAFANETKDYVDSNGSILEVGGIFQDRPGQDMQPQVSREVIELDGYGEALIGVGPNVGGKKKKNDDGDSSDSSDSGNQSDSGSDGPSQGGEPDTADWSWDWLPGVATGADVGGEAILETDHGEDLDDPSDDTTSVTFEVDAGADFSANAFSAGHSSERAGSATLTVDVNADGEITGVIVETTGITSDTAYDDADAESTTWTTEIPVENESDRETVEAWLLEGGDMPPADGIREQPPQDGSTQSEFNELVYNSGVTTNETHAIASDGGGWGLGAKLAAIGLGIGESNSSASEELKESQYLQPPESPGESRTMADAPC